MRFDGAGQGRKEIALIFNEYHDSGGHRYITSAMCVHYQFSHSVAKFSNKLTKVMMSVTVKTNYLSIFSKIANLSAS